MDKFTKTDGAGAVDITNSVASYKKALEAWDSMNYYPSDAVESAIEAALDRFPNKRVPVPVLVSAAIAELSADPKQHKVLDLRCRDYIKNQSANNTGRLDIVKGAGGGVARLALPGMDVPTRLAKVPKKAK